MECQECGKQLIPGKKFCGGCGATVVEKAEEPASSKNCHACGKELVPGKKFCGGCGETVPTSSAAAPAPAPAPAAAPAAPLCSCGAKLDLSRRFCGSCGAPSEGGAPAKPEPVKTPLSFGAGHVKKDVSVGSKIKLETCPICKTTAHSTESLKFGEDTYHESCFKCQQCSCILTIQRATLIDGQGLFCTTCSKPKLLAKGLEKQKGVNLDMGASLTTVAKNACPVCQKTAYEAESFKYNERMYHPACFKCSECAAVLDQRTVNQEEDDKSGPIWCKQCFHKNIIAKKRVTANAAKQTTSNPLAAKFGTNQKCPQCDKTAYKEESESLNGILYHKACMQCKTCGCSLNLRLLTVYEGLLYCKKCQHHLVAFAKIDMVAHPKAFEEHMRAAGIHDYTAKGGTGTVVSSTLPSNASERPAPMPKPVSDDAPAAPVSVYKSNPNTAPPAVLQKGARVNSPFLQRDQGGPATFNNTASEPKAEPKPELKPQGSISKMAQAASCPECQEEYDPPDAKFCMICGSPRPMEAAKPAPTPAAAAPKSPVVKPFVAPKESSGPPPKASPTQEELDARPRYEGKVDPSRQGLLIKSKTAKGKDQMRGGWQPRFFILNTEDKSLAYFTGGGAYGPPAGIVRLEGAECAPTSIVSRKETLCFRIVEQQLPLKFYYIAAESERARDDWVASIRHAINS